MAMLPITTTLGRRDDNVFVVGNGLFERDARGELTPTSTGTRTDQLDADDRDRNITRKTDRLTNKLGVGRGAGYAGEYLVGFAHDKGLWRADPVGIGYVQYNGKTMVDSQMADMPKAGKFASADIDIIDQPGLTEQRITLRRMPGDGPAKSMTHLAIWYKADGPLPKFRDGPAERKLGLLRLHPAPTLMIELVPLAAINKFGLPLAIPYAVVWGEMDEDVIIDGEASASPGYTGEPGDADTLYYWRFGAMRSAADQAGNASSATLVNGATIGANGLDLDRSNAECATAEFSLLGLGEEWTIEAWVKFDPDCSSGYYTIFSQYGLCYLAKDVGHDSDEIELLADIRLSDDSWVRPSGVITVTAGDWHHVALTWKRNDTATLWFDGVAVDSETIPDLPIRNDAQAGNIGRDSRYTTGTGADQRTFDGYIDELRFSTAVRYTDTFTPSGEPSDVNATVHVLADLTTSNDSTLTLVDIDEVLVDTGHLVEVGLNVDDSPGVVFDELNAGNGWTSLGLIDEVDRIIVRNASGGVTLYDGGGLTNSLIEDCGTAVTFYEGDSSVENCTIVDCSIGFESGGFEGTTTANSNALLRVTTPGLDAPGTANANKTSPQLDESLVPTPGGNCYDAAYNGTAPGLLDLAGNPRVYDNYLPDIGAYESQENAPAMASGVDLSQGGLALGGSLLDLT